jgi:HK97 family phage prohead protease
MTKKTTESVLSRTASDLSVRASDDERTLVFPLSSEEPYSRYYWEHGRDLDEILSHGEGQVDLTFLNSGNAPLLDGHKSHDGLDAQIGVIRKAWLENKRLYIEVKFSNRPRAVEIYNDVKDGIIRNVSVGYTINRYEIDEDNDELRATLWTPKEGSLVPIPADTTVGIGRNATVTQKGANMPNETKALPGMDTRTDDQRAEDMTSAIDEISALGAEHNMSDIARSFIQGCMVKGIEPSIAVFRGIVRSQLPANVPLVNEDVGLTENERQSFSVVKLLRYLENPTGSGNREDAEFEIEASEAAKEKAQAARERGGHVSAVGGMCVPTDVCRSWSNFTDVDGVNSRNVSPQAMQQMLRAAFGTGTTSASNILTTDHMAGSFIDSLRNTSAVIGAGATILEGLSSNVEIPGADQDIAVQWLAAEDDDAAESLPTFRKVTMSPHDVAAHTPITRRMLQQSTIAFEAYVRSQLSDGARIAIDYAALYGSGASGQPEGVANISGIVR